MFPKSTYKFVTILAQPFAKFTREPHAPVLVCHEAAADVEGEAQVDIVHEGGAGRQSR